MAVIVQLLALVFGAPSGIGGQRDGEQIGFQAAYIVAGQVLLHVKNIGLVVVDGVQGGSGGRGHPSSGGAGFGMAAFFRQHFRHQIGHRPHAFANLRFVRQTAGQAGLHIAGFVGFDPGTVFHVVFADHRAGVHGGVDFVAGAVEKTGIDEDHAPFGGGDAGGQIERGAALFVHNPHFQSVGRQAGEFLDGGKQAVGKGDFFGAVHFRFDDIHRTAAAVFIAVAGKIEGRDQRGHHAVEYAFGDFLAVGIEHGWGGHQVADVADKQQRAAGQAETAAVGRGVFAVGIQAAGQGFAVFLDFFAERAAH